MTGRRSRPWRDNLEAVTIALVVAVLFKYFVGEAYKIPTGSMQPTLFGWQGDEAGGVFDRILVDKASYHWRDPERFEVVVFRYPHDQKIDYIKRIVALEGDVVEVRAGVLFVNETEHPRTFTSTYEYTTATCGSQSARRYIEYNGERDYTVLSRDGVQAHETFGPVTVREGHFFAMGDNRDNSSDSRIWGQVPLDHVVGLIAQDD